MAEFTYPWVAKLQHNNGILIYKKDLFGFTNLNVTKPLNSITVKIKNIGSDKKKQTKIMSEKKSVKPNRSIQW